MIKTPQCKLHDYIPQNEPGKGPDGSIDFLTCHDGFTLDDLVSYNGKHNEANGENNQDGTNNNRHPSDSKAGICPGRRFPMNQRVSGILLHPTSLSNPYPIGDLGPAATAFVDFLFESGQHWWQMLPIGPTGEDNSPYQSSSAFAGNPLLISPDRLVEQGLLDRDDIEVPISGDEGRVDYPAASRLKLQWLKKAFEHFEKNRNGGRQTELDAFVHAESFWLEDFSLFSSIRGKEGTSDWTRWDHELRMRRPDAIIRAQQYFADDIRYHQFVQWQFSVQWKGLTRKMHFNMTHQ